jgi:uncharacterized coiled-coil protein SlyX
MASRSESELIAEEVSALGVRIAELETRLASVDQVIARLEGAALSTAQALQEISRHWDAVYEAMRRSEDPDVGQLRSERESPRRVTRKR